MVDTRLDLLSVAVFVDEDEDEEADEGERMAQHESDEIVQSRLTNHACLRSFEGTPKGYTSAFFARNTGAVFVVVASFERVARVTLRRRIFDAMPRVRVYRAREPSVCSLSHPVRIVSDELSNVSARGGHLRAGLTSLVV